MESEAELLTAGEAAELLGVKQRTLYAYVSRGQLESVAGGAGRARRYRRSELLRLKARRGLRGGAPRVLAQGALRWGEPVLESSVSLMTEEGPHYRGRSAIELAQDGVGFEQVAELLWTSALPSPRPTWPDVAPGARPLPVRVRGLVPLDAGPLTRLAALVPLLATRDAGRFDRRPEAVLPRARALIRAMAAFARPAVVESDRPEPVSKLLARGLGARGGKAAVAAIDQALVLWADHELNVSAFAARVAASADADIYSCVAAGLAALSGPRHGGACDQIEALIEEAGRAEEAERVLHDRARRGDPVPGFDHPLYPRGDPRARVLLETVRALPRKRSPRLETALAIVAAAEQGGRLATIDTALVALAAALDLPPRTAAAIVAVGRCAGWVAHVLEQYQAGFLIRPRARYPDA